MGIGASLGIEGVGGGPVGSGGAKAAGLSY